MSQGKTEFSDAISSVEEIIEDARRGRMFILVDHEDRENEGDLVIPAQMCDAAAINFMAPGLLRLAADSKMGGMLGHFKKVNPESSEQSKRLKDTAFQSAMKTYCALIDVTCSAKFAERTRQDYDVLEMTARRYLAHEIARNHGNWTKAAMFESSKVLSTPSTSGVDTAVLEQYSAMAKKLAEPNFYGTAPN